MNIDPKLLAPWMDFLSRFSTPSPSPKALEWLKDPAEPPVDMACNWEVCHYKLLRMALHDFFSDECCTLIFALDQIVQGNMEIRNILQDYWIAQIDERYLKLDSKFSIQIQRAGGERFRLRLRPSYKKIKKKLKKTKPDPEELPLSGYVRERGVSPPWYDFF